MAGNPAGVDKASGEGAAEAMRGYEVILDTIPQEALTLDDAQAITDSICHDMKLPVPHVQFSRRCCEYVFGTCFSGFKWATPEDKKHGPRITLYLGGHTLHTLLHELAHHVEFHAEGDFARWENESRKRFLDAAASGRRRRRRACYHDERFATALLVVVNVWEGKWTPTLRRLLGHEETGE